MIAHGQKPSHGIGAVLFSGFEKAAANLGIELTAVVPTVREYAEHALDGLIKAEGRLVVNAHISDKGPGSDLDHK